MPSRIQKQNITGWLPERQFQSPIVCGLKVNTIKGQSVLRIEIAELLAGQNKVVIGKSNIQRHYVENFRKVRGHKLERQIITSL